MQPKWVDQKRAAVLLGVSENELCRISVESGVGRTERSGRNEQVVFTYEELRKICALSVARAHETSFFRPASVSTPGPGSSTP